MNTKLDTNDFFVGGAGMFIQYHDVIRPVYLYAVIKMILTEQTYGVPTKLIENFTISSIVEWYKNRRYINPLKQLDIKHISDDETLDDILDQILKNDSSIYTLAPTLNIERIFSVYRSQQFSFPIYVYTEEYEKAVKEDVDDLLSGISHQYVYGDLSECLKKCKQNFTYIFSNVELAKLAAEVLIGTYSHVLVASDYRYNYKDNFKNMKYDLMDLMRKHPFLRFGTTTTMSIELLEGKFDNITNASEKEGIHKETDILYKATIE